MAGSGAQTTLSELDSPSLHCSALLFLALASASVDSLHVVASGNFRSSFWLLLFLADPQKFLLPGLIWDTWPSLTRPLAKAGCVNQGFSSCK